MGNVNLIIGQQERPAGNKPGFLVFNTHACFGHTKQLRYFNRKLLLRVGVHVSFEALQVGIAHIRLIRNLE